MQFFKRILSPVTLVAFFMVIVFQSGFAQTVAETTSLILKENTTERLVFQNTVGKIDANIVKDAQHAYTRLSLPGYTHNYAVGVPEVPVKRQLIELPHESVVEVNVLSYDIVEYRLQSLGAAQPLIPVQPSQPKCGSSSEFQINNQVYLLNQFLEQELVSVNILGRMRGVNIARLEVAPIQYNPVEQTIRVYENLQFEIVVKQADWVTTESEKSRLASPYFTAPYANLMNYIPAVSRENFTQYPIKYVIVSDPMFQAQLQPFVEWKTRKGFTVIEAYTDEIGSTTAGIKAYLQGLYDAGTPEDPAPSFVLFVGDISEIPAWNNGDGVTDRNYVEYTGDLFPEIFYGRFSAQNEAQLQPYIDKTLQYEQYTLANPAYLDTVVMIAGMDGSFGASHGNGQINYGTINYFNAEHDIFSHTYLYPESGSNAANIRQNVSDGVGFANYTAHCGPGGWGDPSFSIGDIPALSNQGQYGLLIGNCCSSSEFQTTCFAEEIVRAADKGAVGYIGGSNSTYWDEDFYFGVGVGAISENPPSYEETGLGNYDRAFHDHGEPFGEWYTTMAQHIFAGNMAVTESGSSLEQYYWDIYNLMGDPSLMIYYSEPDVMTVNHPAVITIGQTSISITAVPYAYVGLSMNNELKGMGIADASGYLVLDFESIVTPGDAEIVVTAQNFQPYISTIPVIPAEGPYVVYSSHNVSGLGFTYHESEVVLLTMENVGTEDALGVEVELSTNNPYISLSNNTVNFGDIPAGQSVESPLPVNSTVADNIPDLELLMFDVKATIAAGDVFESSFVDMGHAPILAYQNVVVDDSQGNNNGKLDAGETVDLVISLKNTGSAFARNVLGQLSTGSPYLTINQPQQSYDKMEADSVKSQRYSVTVSIDAPAGITAQQTIDFIADFGISATDVFNLIIGQIPVLIIDLAQSNNSPEAMQSCFEVLTVGHEMVEELPQDMGLYQSLFVCLGTYPNNYVLSTSEGIRIAEFLENGGRVYMEGGDTWAYDPQTAGHSMFHITGTDDGTGDLSVVTGADGTFASGYEFDYDGENSYIDHLLPDMYSFTLFSNQTAGYDVAVAFEDAVYKTVGTSFEFGGLVDNTTSTKDEIMAEVLYFFNIPFVWTDIQKQPESNFELQVYPNPASGLLNITLVQSDLTESTFTVLDVLGRKVIPSKTGDFSESGKMAVSIDVSHVNSGVYYLVVETGKTKMSKKIIINH